MAATPRCYAEAAKVSTYPFNHLSCPKCAQQLLRPVGEWHGKKWWSCDCCGSYVEDKDVLRDGLEYLDREMA